MKSLLLGALAVIALPLVADAQSGNAEWSATLERAKGQTLVLVHQESPSFDETLETFTKQFGIKVDATVARPTVILPRVRTEQSNGQYLWDVWWATTSNMVSVAAPAGMLAKFDDYLIVPELKDPKTWRDVNYIYGDKDRFVFTYSHEVSFSAYRNAAVLPDFKTDNVDSLVDPKLKGKIVVRDASQPNAGAWALTPLYQLKGGDFLRKVLKEMDIQVMNNPQQLDSALIRGGKAVAFGMEANSYSQCVRDDGCKTIKPIADLAAASSRGLSVFKNAPHSDATKIFVNWLLSKEGQELYVKNWAKHNDTGATSMRKDVEPDAAHKPYFPDFSHPKQYVWVATQEGADEVDQTVKIFKEATSR